LTIATGMSGHGFGIAPGMANVISDLVENKRSVYGLKHFALSRFQHKSVN